MKPLALTLAVVASCLTLGAPSAADACAMRRMAEPQAVVAKNAMDEAIKAEKAGNVHSAIREYERAMNGKGTSALRAQAAQEAARLHLKLGRTGAAVNRLKRAVALNPKAGPARLALGALVVADDAPLATTHLLEALKSKDVDHARVQLVLADALARQGMTAQATKALDAAEKLGADAQGIADLRARLEPSANGVAARI